MNGLINDGLINGLITVNNDGLIRFPPEADQPRAGIIFVDFFENKKQLQGGSGVLQLLISQCFWVE